MDDVSALADGRRVMATRKDRQEVLNYLEALDRIPEIAKRDPFTLDDLLEIHNIITKETLNNPQDEGVLRNRQVRVLNGLGETVFMPPLTEEVPKLIDKFLEWFNSSENEEVDSIVIAGLTHYELVRIHPFIDGNGRTARIMATLILYKREFDVKRFFALDDFYDKDRPAYYAALQSVDPETSDVTEWLEYFTDGVTSSIKTVREKILGLSKDVKILKERGQVTLNDRQMKIVEFIIKEGNITNKDVRHMFNISNRASLNEISKLMKLNVLKQEGKGRSIHYILV